MKSNLDSYLEKLTSIFSDNDYREAHQKANGIFLEMGKDPSVLSDIIKQELSKPGFFSKKRIVPVIAFDFFRNKDFSISAHCWLPLPDRREDISNQSIHHHGKLLLTSVAPFGEGYESVIFKPGFSINKETNTVQMEIEKVYKNPLYNIEFIDTNTPHVVFYPANLSITYAMWSYEKKNSILRSVRQSKLLRANKKLVLNAFKKLGLIKFTGVNVLEYFDFYPENGKLLAMKERVVYPVGTNENFVQNLFYILQKTGFNDYDFIRSLRSKLSPEELAVAEKPMQQFLNQEPINDEFEPAHLNIPKINFSKAELMQVYEPSHAYA